ncbi:MAG TPA: selenium-binding protein SBP56-related protein, partial [Planctomycetaceae bacterium]|nr:selenium-binding protein SBP56-related protein [Planctomycetaceae bacterium]
MHRRDFLTATAAAVVSSALDPTASAVDPVRKTAAGHAPTTYASPREAMKAPRETIAFVTATYVATGRSQPDFLATVDLDPASATYSQVIHRLAIP